MSRLTRVPVTDLHTIEAGTTHVRAGVIPYALDDAGNVMWLMGLSNFKRASDFGGGCNEAETAYQCLLREVHEESSGVLTSAIKTIMGDPAYVDDIVVWRAVTIPRQAEAPLKYRYLAFVPINYMADINDHFKPNAETFKLLWVKQSDVLDTGVDINTIATPLHQYIKYLRAC